LGDTVLLGPVKVPAPASAQTLQPANPLGAQFEDGIELLGYNQENFEAGGARLLRLRLLWKANTTPARDYTVFVHLTDSSGEIVAQQDAPPRRGAYPTSFWDAGEVIDDTVELRVPREKEGGLSLWIGLYDGTTMQRLPLRAGNPAPDAVRIPIDLLS
jgi:hypothetical protein